MFLVSVSSQAAKIIWRESTKTVVMSVRGTAPHTSPSDGTVESFGREMTPKFA